MTPSEARGLFADAINIVHAIDHRDGVARREAQAAFDADCERLFRSASQNQRRKYSRAALFAFDAEGVRRLNAVHRQALEERLREECASDFDRRDAERDVQELAAIAEVLPGENEFVLTTVSSLRYASQGYGAKKYAQASAESSMLDACSAGVEARIDISPVSGVPEHATFDVIVKTATLLDVEILSRRPGRPFKEVIRALLGSGANPRVYYPFLSSDYLHQLGLDAFGRDLLTTPAATAA